LYRATGFDAAAIPEKSAQKILGSRFDSREYHQMLLSEGALPFAALNSKVARWVAAHH